MIRGFLQTGQLNCYSESGEQIPCSGSGQDGQHSRGVIWPSPRFERTGATVADLLTGLTWTLDANLAEYPLAWQEALDFIKGMNSRADFGHSDWRLPNRREMRSLVSYQTSRPALPEGHPFVNIIRNWYWTSTTAAINPAYAWYVHMDGARMFYGRKDQYYLVWPVRNISGILPETGQRVCFDATGRIIQCPDGAQDGSSLTGIAWPPDRFLADERTVLDRLTGLRWLRRATLSEHPLSWPEALDLVADLNRQEASRGQEWRLPNINELESLIDSSRHSPALPAYHPFVGVREVYWSSTTSFYEPDWAWALYLTKGALGVGVKSNRNFHAWPVRDGE